MSTHDAPFVLDDRFEDALARMREVLGDQTATTVAHEYARAHRRWDPARVAVPVATTWGWLLDRPTLSVRDRALALVAVDVARGSEHAFHDHVRLALHAGVSERELHELLIQLGPFAGYPSVNDASTRLRAILAATRQRIAFEKDAGLARCRLVVRDAPAAARLLSTLLGIRSWSVLRGQEIAAVGTTPGGTTFEILAPGAAEPDTRLRLLAHGPFVAGVALAAARANRPGMVAEVGGLTLSIVDAEVGARVNEEWTFDRSEEMAATGLGDGPLDHLGLATSDLAATTRDLARTFGARRWRAVRFGTDDGSLTEATYAGEPARLAYLSAMARVGDFRIEVCQPVLGRGRYGDGFLDVGGRGVQHMFFGATTSVEEWQATCRAITSALGLSPVETATAWGGVVRYAYVPTRELVGFDLELAIIPPNVELDPSTQASLLLDHRPGSLSADPDNPATDQKEDHHGNNGESDGTDP